MPAPCPVPSRRSLVVFAVLGMLLPACQKRESESSARDTGSAAPRPADKQAPAALGMKLDDPQAALDFLEHSGLKLRGAKDDCTLLAEEHETLGALVRKSRERATEKSIRCEPSPGSKTWSCEAEFIRSGGDNPEASEFAIKLRYTVDDATRTIPTESLVCLMAG